MLTTHRCSPRPDCLAPGAISQSPQPGHHRSRVRTPVRNPHHETRRDGVYLGPGAIQSFQHLVRDTASGALPVEGAAGAEGVAVRCHLPEFASPPRASLARYAPW
jgi:hypothetical protein